MTADKPKREKITSPEFRVSYPHVFKPHRAPGATADKYSLTMLFDKGTDLTALKQLAAKTAQAFFGDKLPELMSSGKFKNPFRDGDKEKGGSDGYKNVVFVAASANLEYPPSIIDKNKNDILDPKDFYAGCYARASLTCYAYDKAGNKGVAFGLQNIQKLRDGPAFSGRTSAQDDFDVVGGDDTDDYGPTESAMFG